MAIDLRNLSKTFHQGWRRAKVRALQDVTLTIKAGEAFGFIGQNGAGKSTTIKILTGALRHDSGEARLFGINVSDFHSRVGLGYVPENPWLYDYLTPLEIVSMGVTVSGRRKGADVRSHSLAWLKRFDLDHVAERRVRGFSKGMLQRTALAHAMACEPRLLILDEPLSGLDPLGRREVVDILVDYRRSGGTVFFSSHVLHDVERLADRYGLIHQGQLRAVSSPAELLGQDEMVTVRSQGGYCLKGQDSEVGNGWIMSCARSELWSVMDSIRNAGQSIREIRPQLSLEAAFMRAIAPTKDSSEQSRYGT